MIRLTGEREDSDQQGSSQESSFDNMPYNLADMFEKVIRASFANPQLIIDRLKDAFEYE